MRRRRWLTATVAGAALLLVVGRLVSGLVVDYRWFAALGAERVWWARMSNLLALRAGGMIVATAFVFLNLYAVRQSVVSVVLPRRVANLEIGEEVPPRYLFLVVAFLSILLGAVLAMALDDWQSLVLVRQGALFQESDPYFQFDLGFFVYWLPFESGLRLWSLLVLAVVSGIVVLLYALTPSLRWDRGALRVSGYVRRHFTALGAVLLLLLAWSYRIDAYTLLIDGTGDAGGFTAVDHRVGIPVYLLLAFLTATAALLVLWAGWTAQVRLAFGTVTTVLVLSLVLRQLLPPIAMHLLTPADPGARERPYIATRAGYTRRAFAVDRIARDDSTYGFESLREAALGVSLWDPPALARAVERGARQGEVNGDMGWSGDGARLVARVIERPVGPESADPLTPWLQTDVLAAVADDRGAPVSPQRDGSSPEPIPAALIHDGATGYLIVPDRRGEIAAPAISSWWTRLAHAWDQQNLNILVGDLPQPEPRLVLRRDVRERVRTMLPFFAQGREVAPVVSGDTLYWALHLYSASNWYPLSDRIRAGDHVVRYLYHAAVALVHAGSGRVLVVADTALDPIATTWRDQFPELFASRDSLPGTIIAQIPPGIDGAIAQAAAFARVGLRGEPTIPSHLPGISGADSVIASGESALFASPRTGAPTWDIPILDASDRVRGLIVAEGGASSETRWLPFTTTGPRWPSIVGQLQRTPDSAAVPAAARLVRGRVRPIPTPGGAFYVQSSYAWRAEGAPAVTRIALLHGDTIRTGRSLPELAGVGESASMAPHPPGTLPEFRERAQQLYGAMRDALRRGDWRAFGQAYDALGRLLQGGRAPATAGERSPPAPR